MHSLQLLASILLCALAACDPYDPNLGNEPFRCGATDPKCPDGYACVDQVCKGGGPAGPDAGVDSNNLTCDDDSSMEPNDDLAHAWTTPIPDTMASVGYVQLAICPSTDKDLFRFRVDANGKNMKTTVTTDVASGPLLLQVLNGAGATIANGQATSQTKIVVAVNNLAAGAYYVQVAANGVGVQNNYTIDIATCDVVCP